MKIRRYLILSFIAILIAVGLFFIITTSINIRYWADDFCSATLLRAVGFLGAQVSWWQNWTGRYSYIFFLDLFELIGQWGANILPFILLVGAFAGLYGFYKYGKVLPILFVLLTLINAPNIIQSFYWQTGSLNYFAPFIFLNIFLSFLFVSNNKKLLYIAFLIMLIAGGFSEAFALAVVPLLIIIILIFKLTSFKNKNEKLKLAYWGLAGIILSLGIMYLSPGNAVREVTVTRPSSLLFVIKSTLLGTKWYLLRIIGIKDFIYSVILAFAAIFILGRNFKLKSREAIIIISGSLISIVLTTMAVIFSGFYAESILPPERALFIAIYIILICVFAFSAALTSIVYSKLHGKEINIISWIIVALGIVASALLIKSEISHWSSVRKETSNYAQAWDKEVKNLPNIKNIKPVGELDSFTDNKGWVGQCIKNYYGLREINIIY